MKEELDKKLVQDFPILYQDRYKDMRVTAMCWGFQCADGWEPLIRRLSEKLETWNNNHPGKAIIASEVKEKLGTLRFYYYVKTEKMTICEKCMYKIRILLFRLRLGKLYWRLSKRLQSG